MFIEFWKIDFVIEVRIYGLNASVVLKEQLNVMVIGDILMFSFEGMYKIIVNLSS